MRDCAPDGCHVCSWKELLCCSALYPTRSLLRTRTIKCLDSKINFSFLLLSFPLLQNPYSESIEHNYQYNALKNSLGKQTIYYLKWRNTPKNQTRSKTSGVFIKMEKDKTNSLFNLSDLCFISFLLFLHYCLCFNNDQTNKAHCLKNISSATLVN